MPWSADLQHIKDQLIEALIHRCREEVGSRKPICASTDPCRTLGICEEDLDDVQIDAAAIVGLRPPFPGEPLILPWQGPDVPMTLEDLAAWLAVNGRPISQGRDT